MPNYMVLLYESRSVWDCMSPNEVQSVIQKYTDWSKRLADQGHYVAGQKLNMSTPGRVLRCNGRKIAVTDGPFAESKEVLGGLMAIQADSYDHAVRLAEEGPHLERGTVEIREIEFG